MIELLVVIAIIGILSTVVFARLSTARDRSKISVFKSEMDSFRKQAEVFYSNGNTYLNLFTVTSSPVVDATAHASIQTLFSSLITRAADTTMYGSITTDSFVLYGRVPNTTTSTSLLAADIWCIDNTGKSGNPTTDATNQFTGGTIVTQCW